MKGWYESCLLDVFWADQGDKGTTDKFFGSLQANC